jgi:hypothetical protein
MLLQCYKEHGEAFLCTTVTGDETWVFHYIPESKAESMTRKHPHSPVKKGFKTVQSRGKVMATVFWDIYEVLLVDFAPPSSTINPAACQKTLERLKEAIWIKRPELLTQGDLLLHDNAQPHDAAKTVTLLGMGNSSTSTQLWCGTVRLPVVPKDEKTPQRSAVPLHWRCSKWSQEMVTVPGQVFSMMELTNWYITVKSV